MKSWIFKFCSRKNLRPLIFSKKSLRRPPCQWSETGYPINFDPSLNESIFRTFLSLDVVTKMVLIKKDVHATETTCDDRKNRTSLEVRGNECRFNSEKTVLTNICDSTERGIRDSQWLALQSKLIHTRSSG